MFRTFGCFMGTLFPWLVFLKLIPISTNLLSLRVWFSSGAKEEAPAGAFHFKKNKDRGPFYIPLPMSTNLCHFELFLGRFLF